MPHPRITPGVGRLLSFPARRRAAAVIATAALLITGIAACDSAADAPVAVKGGTLRLVVPELPSHLDPQKIAEAFDANLSRLLSRTLTTYRSEPGAASSELVPDLATDLGRPSEGNKVWEFNIREGAKWEDGTPVNCQQLKYGVERNFSSLFTSGLPYAKLYLVDNTPPFKGPFVGGNKELDSVTCTDQHTIRYRLKQPVGDFNYTVALPLFSPVKQGADSDKDAYDREPLSNGPYRFKEGARTEKELVLVRNEHWDPATDKIRKALPDEIRVVADSNVPAVTNALIQDQGEARNTVLMSQDIAPNFLQQVVNDPVLSARTATGPTGAVRYFAVNTRLIPDVRCRQAIVYAFNKRKYRQAMGGSVMGDLATSIIPPGLKAHQNFDHYNTATVPDGDIRRAEQLIAEAKADKVTCPKKLIVSHPDNPTVARFVKTLVDAYLRIGIQVELHPVKPTEELGYFDLVSDPATPYHLIYSGWVPDWANGSAVLPPLFQGNLVPGDGEYGGSNYSRLENPEIDQAISEAMAESDQERQWRLWGELDSKLAEMATTVPVLFPNAIRMMGSNVRGSFIHSQYGQPDVCALGLVDAGATPST